MKQSSRQSRAGYRRIQRHRRGNRARTGRSRRSRRSQLLRQQSRRRQGGRGDQGRRRQGHRRPGQPSRSRLHRSLRQDRSRATRPHRHPGQQRRHLRIRRRSKQITPEHFHKQFNLNVLGLLLTTQAAVEHFNPAGGSIINIGSVVCFGLRERRRLQRHQGRGQLDHAFRSAKELGPKKIRVNALNPGMVETEGTHAAGFIGSDFAEARRISNSARPHRPAARYRRSRRLSGLRRFRLAQRPDHPRLRRLHRLTNVHPLDGELAPL